MNVLLFNEPIHQSDEIDQADCAAIENFKVEYSGSLVVDCEAQREELRQSHAFMPYRAYLVPCQIIRNAPCMERIYAALSPETHMHGAEFGAESQMRDECLICSSKTNCGIINPNVSAVYIVNDRYTRFDARVEFKNLFGITPDIRIPMLGGFIAIKEMTLCGLCNRLFGYECESDQLSEHIEYVSQVDYAWYINNRKTVIDRLPANYNHWRAFGYIKDDKMITTNFFTVWRVMDSFPDGLKKYIQHAYLK
jgi:hypothetical protein